MQANNLNFTGDVMQRFVYGHTRIRGEFVRLDAVWRSMLDLCAYPPAVRRQLGELCAAVVLLKGILELDGSLTLQVHGKGVLGLMVVECYGDLEIRAVAKWDGTVRPDSTLRELLGEAHMEMVISSDNDQRMRQSFVAMDGENFAEVLGNFMRSSEAVESQFWLAADENQAVGMVLQKTPVPHDETADEESGEWGNTGSDTLKPQDMLRLTTHELVQRLKQPEDISLFEPRPVKFNCHCSRASVAEMLYRLGKVEVDGILFERGKIEIRCEFCNRHYKFEAADIEAIFADGKLGGKPTLH